MRSDTGTSGSMRAAVTKRLWRTSEAWRGNPTSCLRRGAMRVMGGVGVQGETAGSRSGKDNSRERLDNADSANHFQNTTFGAQFKFWLFLFLLV